MVRSSSHRKRSRSRSPSPDHKRKSVRDYDKDRIRRRSRSRDRLRRSRSRDRKNIKIESRVRARPFKLKRRSRSRSKSKEKSSKKDEKKDSKPEEEPFDPTSLDKVPDDDDDVWVVTDALEEPLGDDNGVMEEEYDYEADEDDQYPHTSFPDKDGSLVEKICENADDYPEPELENADNSDNPNDSTNCEKEEYSLVAENDTLVQDDNGNNDNGKKETGDDNQESATKEREENHAEEGTSNVIKDPEEKNKSIKGERNPVKDLANKIKDSCSTHKDNISSLSTIREANAMKNISLFANGPRAHVVFSEELVRLTKNHIRQSVKLDREMHDTRMKHEVERHKAELEVIKFQLSYWRKKLKH